MTKQVRVENADNGTSFSLVVQVWDKQYVAPGETPKPDVLAKEIELKYPTALASEYITDTRYLVVKELRLPDPVPIKVDAQGNAV